MLNQVNLVPFHFQLKQILELVSKYKWAEKATGALAAFRTNYITTFQGNLFSKYITDKYKEIFEDECKALNAPKNVDIIQRNVKISSLRKLLVAEVTASHILSEGEQRAISLADFLTESQLNPQNRGLVFDDPVSSLDHLRKNDIAFRL